MAQIKKKDGTVVELKLTARNAIKLEAETGQSVFSLLGASSKGEVNAIKLANIVKVILAESNGGFKDENEVYDALDAYPAGFGALITEVTSGLGFLGAGLPQATAKK